MTGAGNGRRKISHKRRLWRRRGLWLGVALLGSSAVSHAETIDPCIVGTWKATAVASLGATKPPTGGEGFVVTFSSDGIQAIDYATMSAQEWLKGVPGNNGLTYRGTARGRISTADGRATLEALDEQKVTMQIWNAGGPTQDEAPFGPVAGLGPGGLGSTAADNGYACTDGKLEYKASIAKDKHPTHLVTLARVGDAAPGVAAVPESTAVTGAGTWLTMTEIKDREQDIAGMWRDTGRSAATDLMSEEVHFVRLSPDGALTDHTGPHETEAWSLDLRAAGDDVWEGKVQVCPTPYGTCLNLCRWVTGSMRSDASHLRMTVAWRDRKTRLDCSGLEDQPDSGSFTLDRVVGASFVPVAPGKFLAVAGTPAVGDQAAQFSGGARIAMTYPGVPEEMIRVTTDRGKVVARGHATYDVEAASSGTQEIRVDLSSSGVIFHTDRLRIDMPALSGVGK
jgi:hypothetical protein